MLRYEIKVSVYVRIVGHVDGSGIRIIEEAESDRDVLGNDRQWGHFAAECDRQQDGVRAGVPHVDLNHRVTDARDIGRVNQLWCSFRIASHDSKNCEWKREKGDRRYLDSHGIVGSYNPFLGRDFEFSGIAREGRFRLTSRELFVSQCHFIPVVQHG